MTPNIEKLRNIFLATFFFLVITIIFTPLLVRNGFSLLSEEVLESILLLTQMSAGWQIFRLYQRTVEKREKEIKKLRMEYQKREKDLLEAFAYLGKVNVQVSLIQSFLQKIKAPSSRKEAESYIKEILKIALSLSRKDWVTLRAMDSQTFQTTSEYWVKANANTDTSGIKIGNKEIVKWEKDKNLCARNGLCVFGSSGSELSSLKVFLIFLNGERVEPDIEDFLRAVANQCEVLLTLFDLKGRNGN
ncbi:MAG: hypothetical protein A3J76_00905 [Candidatus Moranbacteria bacterium RBG_13_45_13]|nr:MAG: hypothetical protein A3J76_00905 [Candidatus Moranbacteria bacterium RBG_13_45_13]